MNKFLQINNNNKKLEAIMDLKIQYQISLNQYQNHKNIAQHYFIKLMCTKKIITIIAIIVTNVWMWIKFQHFNQCISQGFWVNLN